MHPTTRTPDSNRQSFTIAEIAERNTIARSTVYNEIAAGRLRSYKIGRVRRVSAEAESEWIRSLEREAAA